MSALTDILIKSGVGLEKCAKFEAFARMLKDANSKFNLTRIVGDEDMARLHFLDSISPAMMNLIPSGAHIIDIGTGGGFPCVPLAIFCDDVQITAIEASEKKLMFVKRVSDELGLNIECICTRAEDAAFSELRECFDICVSRAVAPLNILLELITPFAKVGGKLICYKGINCAEEIELANNARSKLNLSEPAVYPAGVEGVEHVIAVFKKNSATSKAYPRRYSKIKSAPL